MRMKVNYKGHSGSNWIAINGEINLEFTVVDVAQGLIEISKLETQDEVVFLNFTLHEELDFRLDFPGEIGKFLYTSTELTPKIHTPTAFTYGGLTKPHSISFSVVV